MSYVKLSIILVVASFLSSCSKDVEFNDNLVEIEQEYNQHDYLEFQKEIYPNLNQSHQDFFSKTFAQAINSHAVQRTEDRSSNDLINKAIINLYTQNIEGNFLDYMIEHTGYPAWNHSLEPNDDPNSIFIPFFHANDTLVRAFLFGEKRTNSDVFDFNFQERKFVDTTASFGHKMRQT